MQNKSSVFFSFILTIIILCTCNSLIADTIVSDPDHISTGIKFSGVPAATVGDSFNWAPFSLGAMAEIRNEEKFNQGALPNHNWRGFLFFYYEKFLIKKKSMIKFTSGFEHESAHPTMGLNDWGNDAYDGIYDGTYRNINMNSILLRLSRTSGSGYSLTLTGDMQFYFYSRNTPELPERDLAWSEGFSGGFEFRYPAGRNTDFFISGFDRYIFRSKEKAEGSIYYDSGSGLETRDENYPVINSVNTISAKAGFIFSNIIPDKKISICCGFIYGNIYGFVDSREKRKVYTIGIELFN